MPGNILVELAIGVIIIGFVILAGVAFWLALERRRTLSAAPGRPAPQRGSQPAAAQQPATPPSQEQKAAPQPAAPPTSSSAAPAATSEKASSATPATPQTQKEVLSSGEYPSAALYDQTILPEPPRRRTRPRSQ